MLNKCHKYVIAIDAKGAPFPTEPLIMALLLSQHKMIKWLSEQDALLLVISYRLRSFRVSHSGNREFQRKASRLKLR
jgi:hypothetical protein